MLFTARSRAQEVATAVLKLYVASKAEESAPCCSVVAT